MRHLQIFRLIAAVARQGAIRKSAEQVHLTPSALTRRIQEFEEELGTPIFERLPHGMRLNAVGDLLLAHIRNQEADFERFRSQVADLAGARRGHVSMACAQAFVDRVLPEEIALYRAKHPGVTFSVEVRDNRAGVNALVNYEADLALLIDPFPSPEVHEILVKKQPLCAVVSKSHPLAGRKSVTLRECCAHPIAMPSPSLAIRVLIDEALHQRHIEYRRAVESGSLEFLRSFVRHEPAVTFHPLSGVPQADERLSAVPISADDLHPMRVVLAQLKGRPLSVAAATFGDQLSSQLADISM